MADPTMHCHLCPEVTAIDAIVDHVRLMHPDVWDGTVVTFSSDDIVTSTDQETSRFTAPRAGWYRFTRRLG